MKYLGFSGHDDTIIAFLMQWGLSSQQCHLDLINGVKLKEGEPCLGTPDFGANLIWELRRDTETDSYSVRVLYNGEPLEISCGKEKKVTECSFEHFQKEMHANFIFTKEREHIVCNHYRAPKEYET